MSAAAFCLSFFTTAPATSQGAPSAPPLQALAEEIVASVRGDWSVLAWSIDRRETLFAIEPHRILVPASNNKVFTSVWALETLGATYRFHTDLLLAGRVDDGVLHGDVVLRGSGDPGFGYPEFVGDPMTPLRRMASSLRAHGVRRVAGRVVGDGSVFDSTRVGPAWPQDTGGGSSAYAPSVSGLAFQRNLLTIELEAIGNGRARVHRIPAVEEIPVVARLRPGSGRALAARRAASDTIFVQGEVPAAGRHRYAVGVADPTLLAAAALRRALIDEGIEVDGRAVRGATPVGARVLHRHVSLPLAALLPRLNQDSDNFFAEHLYKATVAAAVGIGSYDRGGPASAVFFNRRFGIPFGELWQADGSGLSAYNRASAYGLVRTLVYANEAEWGETFAASLALAAERGGTMRRMFLNTAAAGNLRAKTGYVRNARTLSGYVRTRDGQLVAFSFLYNGSSSSAARGAQERLGALLADHVYDTTRLAGGEATRAGEPPGRRR